MLTLIILALLMGSYNKGLFEIIQYIDSQHNGTHICDCHCAAKTTDVNATVTFNKINLNWVAFTLAVFAAQSQSQMQVQLC